MGGGRDGAGNSMPRSETAPNIYIKAPNNNNRDNSQNNNRDNSHSFHDGSRKVALSFIRPAN